MTLHRSFEPDPDLKGSYYRRLEDIPRALAKFEVTALPANSPAQFVAYYFGAEKLAKAIVGIYSSRSAEAAFDVGVRLPETKDAARDMKLSISAAELDALLEHQSRSRSRRAQSRSAIACSTSSDRRRCGTSVSTRRDW